ncbi:MAG: hypothetical protein ACI9YL_000922 [Luteibaculaceae bacterium]|jgi:uncharacterized protein
MDQINSFANGFAKGTKTDKVGVLQAIKLLKEGATIPFISRYRKEQTKGLDEVQLIQLAEDLEIHEKMEERRIYVLESLRELGVDSSVLEKVKLAQTLAEIEDLYLPFKPKRKTKAQKARDAGLEPLYLGIIQGRDVGWKKDWQRYISSDFSNGDEVLSGVLDLIVESISENAEFRKMTRDNFWQYAYLTSKPARGKKEEAEHYTNYFEYKTHWTKASSHQILGMFRGAKEKLLNVQCQIEEDFLVRGIGKVFPVFNFKYKELRQDAIESAVKNYLCPSIETELKQELSRKAQEKAISVFQKNLKTLLLSEPLGEKIVLAIDPGFKSGCKMVVIDALGGLIFNETIYPHPPQLKVDAALKKVKNVVESYKVDAIAIGDGTAGRETENFIGKIKWTRDIEVYMVNEDGASVYSASTIGRKELPDYDVTVRGSVSIGRRLQDPLAELVKIDPKSLGVGQYQHDVDQKKLEQGLETTVVSVVNEVGVDINSASSELLKYVAGLNQTTAANIVDYRTVNGRIKNRKELLKVKGLGPKAYEQCSGFLKVREGNDLLDNTSIHPEKYAFFKNWLKSRNVELSPAFFQDRDHLMELAKAGEEQSESLDDKSVFQELAKPFRRKRQFVKAFAFSEALRSISDVHVGMILPGIISNVAQFGAFVKLGIKENGLIHVSKLKSGFVSDPLEVVDLNQQVLVKVISVDQDKKRIGLELIQKEGA